MKAILYRSVSCVFGTFGTLYLYDDQGKKVGTFVVGEDDWLDNKPQKSCIPDGTYTCRRVQSPTFGNTFEVTSVPGRSAILFHAGNTEEDTKGCLLVGTRFGMLKVKDEDTAGNPVVEKWAVVESAKAFKEFLALLTGVSQFTLEIRWDFHGWR